FSAVSSSAAAKVAAARCRCWLDLPCGRGGIESRCSTVPARNGPKRLPWRRRPCVSSSTTARVSNRPTIDIRPVVSDNKGRCPPLLRPPHEPAPAWLGHGLLTVPLGPTEGLLPGETFGHKRGTVGRPSPNAPTSPPRQALAPTGSTMMRIFLVFTYLVLS